MMSRSVKSIIALVVCAVLAACAFTAFGFSKSFGANTDRSANGKVIFFNFKPEATAAWQEVAEKYTKQTGVTVSINTPTGGQYEKGLKTAVEKYKNNPDEMPT
ncbi:ABC transporter substrate-binding protein, partial [Bifidobacteriaceae bacterium WP022]